MAYESQQVRASYNDLQDINEQQDKIIYELEKEIARLKTLLFHFTGEME